MRTKLPIIAPYIYDARYHAHPYNILSTTVLSDKPYIYNQKIREKTHSGLVGGIL